MKLGAILLLVISSSGAWAQTMAATPQAVITFSVSNPKVEPAQYTLEIREDGSGVYEATYTAQGQDTAAAPVNRPIQVHDPVLKQIFAAARHSHFFAAGCELPHDRVAFTGKKTLAYSGADGKGSCTFNYSKEKAINEAAASLVAVATTLAMGDDLAREHKYDPLSLDGDLAALQSSVAARQALEVENITPLLQSIASDNAVMNRARARAEKLLREAPMTR